MPTTRVRLVADDSIRAGASFEVEVDGEWVRVQTEIRGLLLEQNILPLAYPSTARNEEIPSVMGLTGQGELYVFRGMIRHRLIADLVRIFENGDDPPGLVVDGPPLELEDDPELVR
jgi:hypothetical protein